MPNDRGEKSMAGEWRHRGTEYCLASNVERIHMPDTLTKNRVIPAPSHPLDPLTQDEIRCAATALRAAHDLGAGMMFETISLSEPEKSVVQAFQPGARVPRVAFVCAFDRNNGKVYEAQVDLATGKVLDWRHVPDVRPRILID